MEIENLAKIISENLEAANLMYTENPNFFVLKSFMFDLEVEISIFQKNNQCTATIVVTNAPKPYSIQTELFSTMMSLLTEIKTLHLYHGKLETKRNILKNQLISSFLSSFVEKKEKNEANLLKEMKTLHLEKPSCYISSDEEEKDDAAQVRKKKCIREDEKLT